MRVDHARLVTVTFEQGLRIRELEREVRLTAAKVDAAFIRPRRVDQGESHNATCGLGDAALSAACALTSHAWRRCRPSRMSTRGLQPTASRKLAVFDT